MKVIRQKRIYYGWIVMSCGILIIICNNGFSCNVFSAYLPFIEENGYSGLQGSTLITIRCIAGAAGVYFVPQFYHWISFRKGLALNCIFIAIAYIFFGLAKSYLALVAGAVLMGIAYGLGAMVPISILIGNWFEKKRATAIALCAAGTGIAAIAVVPVATLIAERVSLCLSFLMSAAVAIGIAVLTMIVVKEAPSDIGQEPYGREKSTEQSVDNGVSGEKHGIKASDHTKMIFAMVLLGASTMATASHFAVLFSSLAYSKGTIALSISLFGIALTIGKCVFGVVADWLGGKQASFLSFLILVLGGVLCCLAKYKAVYVFCGPVLMGFGFPPATVGISIWAKDFSAEGEYTKILKEYQLSYTIGGVLFSFVPGLVYDFCGSYVLSYQFCTIMILVTMVIVELTYSKQNEYNI